MELDEIIYGKHIDVVKNIEEFNERVGSYIEPWVVYIGNDADGYDIKYSSGFNKTVIDSDVVQIINNRLQALENEKVFCTESEYEIISTTGEGYIKDINNPDNSYFVKFDSSKMYYNYE